MTYRAQFIGQQELPWPEDDHLEGDEIFIRDLDGIKAFDDRATLTDVIKDGYTLFNSGIFQSVGLPFDPVKAAWAEDKLSSSDAPLFVPVGVSLFNGLARPFDRIALAVPNQLTSKLFRHLDRIGLMSGGKLYNAVRQRISVLDPIMFKSRINHNRLPIVNIYLYGLEGDSELFVWKPPADILRQPAKLIRKQKKKQNSSQSSRQLLVPPT